MALTEYLPMVVADPVTKIIRTDLFGTKVTVVLPGTNTPVTGIVEAASGAPLANPITVSSTGFTPWFKINNGPTRVDIVSGDFRTPVWSPSGLEASATAAATSAADTAQGVAEIIELADVVDLIPGANITMTPTPAGVVIASAGTGDGGGDFSGSVTVSQISDRSASGETVLKGTAAQGLAALGGGKSNVTVAGALTGDAAPVTTTVTLSTPQTITGKKTFGVAPAVPDGSFTIGAVVGLQAALNNAAGATNVTLASMPAGYTHSISYTEAAALTSRPAAPTGVIIRIYGGTTDDADPTWMLNADYRDIPVA